jgi:NADH-quinone oxidoreductase subunit G
MINHPHDCPVCDEGGECLLQDFTIAGGHGRRRYQGEKRTHVNQYLGEGICHEMNRCIQCYRCVRFYQDYAGGTDFGVTGSAGRVYFGRTEDGQLESPFSGNLVDICPTGVFTDKTGRYRARYWDYEFAPSICPHCSVGCNTSPQNYQRELIKIVGRRNDQVNGWFICDRGRFDKKFVNDPQRPREPMVNGTVSGYREALDAAAEGITNFIRTNGTGSLAFVGSARLSLEGGILLNELARLLDGSQLCYFVDAHQAQGSVAAAKILNQQNSASALDIEQADCVVLLSVDIMEEAPMLALAVRKAWLGGAQVFSVAAQSGTLKPDQALPFQQSVVPSLDQVPLEGGCKGVIICGAGQKEPELLAHLASIGARLVMLQPGPNGFGAALLALEHDAVSLSEALAANKVKGIVCFEADLPSDLPPEVAVLVCADWRNTPCAQNAHVFLPTTTWVESDGTSVNFEGRAQRFERARRAGLPLRGLDAKYYARPVGEKPLHPPRVHRSEIPGGEERDAWQIMSQLLEKLGGDHVTEPLSGKWSKLKQLDPEGGGVRILALK